VKNNNVETETESEPPKSRPPHRLTPQIIDDYAVSLQESALQWYRIHFPGDTQDEEHLWLDKLNRLGSAYFRPLILAAFMSRACSRESRLELLKAIERFIFLGFRIFRQQANYRESAYYREASNLYRGSATANQIVTQLQNDLAWTMNDDGCLKQSIFSEFIGRKYRDGGGFYYWNGLRYFLYEYEEELNQKQRAAKDQMGELHQESI